MVAGSAIFTGSNNGVGSFSVSGTISPPAIEPSKTRLRAGFQQSVKLRLATTAVFTNKPSRFSAWRLIVSRA